MSSDKHEIQSEYMSRRQAKDRKVWEKMYRAGRKLYDDSRAASFKVAMVADNDADSRTSASTFKSYLETFQLNKEGAVYVLTSLNKKDIVTSVHDSQNRGGELSTLNKFNGKLIAGDDRTGTLFEVLPEEEDPLKRLKVITTLADFKGGKSKLGIGFKCEWATVKDGKLYVGSHGRLEGRPGYPPERMRWIKIVDKNWKVKHVNWSKNYDKLARAVGLTTGKKLFGYLTHEGALWSDIHQRWFFAPRKVSLHLKYDFDQDPIDSSNLLLSCDESFKKIAVRQYKVKDRSGIGSSDLAFVPGSGETEFVCTRTIEVGDELKTWVCVFDLNGDVLLDEHALEDGVKYEGVQVIS